MKVVIQFLIITIVFAFEINAQDAFRFFINNLNMPLDNRGVLADVNIPPHGSLGKYNDISFLFSGGFYLSGYTGDSLWANGAASAGLVTDYQPGIVGSDPTAPGNIIYVVDADDPPFGQSWQDWINAVNLGADFYDGDGDGIYNPEDKNSNGLWDPDEDKPDVLADLTAWCVYNDGVPSSERRWEAEPQGIEIQQTVFAYRNTHPQFSNTVNTIFIRYRIINKGTVTENLDSVFFSFYSDFDLGDPSDDLEGCDTLLAGGFVYNNGPDYEFGDSPPAVFHHFNQFPHTYIPGITFIDNNSNGIFDPGIDIPVDTAYSYRGPEIGVRIIPGARNQNFSSSVYIWKGVPGYSDPVDIYHARNYMLGLTKDDTMLNPCTFPPSGVFGGVICSEVNPVYWLSGDPVTNSGWIHTDPADIRTMGTTGPFKIELNDQYDVIVAYTLGEGTDAINSITVTRENMVFARNAYLSNFGQFPVSVKDDEVVINIFSLYQNYPNPFNPATTIRFEMPDDGFVTLKVYDILGREVKTLLNEFRRGNRYEVQFDASHIASGVYFYKITVNNFVETKKMMLIR